MTKIDNTTDALKLSMYGTFNDKPISPNNVSLLELREMTDNFGKFIKGCENIDLRGLSVSVENGCISLSANNYLQTDSIRRDCSLLINECGISRDVDPTRAAVIDNFQAMANNSPDRKFVISCEGQQITIDSTTEYRLSEPIYVDVEDYIYGELYDMGGQIPNVHLQVEGGDKITIPAQKELLMNAGDRLYRKQLALVSVKEDVKTGARKDYSLLSFENYDPKWDKQKLDDLVDWYSPKISSIPGGAELMINAIRGY